MAKVFVYVDGFNLFYRALKGTGYKWLDIDALCRLLLPGDTIEHIDYFTARVTAQPHDLQQPARQDAYLRALATIPHLSITEGRYIRKRIKLPLAYDLGHVKLRLPEEKQSDVNLVTALLHDAFNDRFETAVLVTNDTDFLAAIHLVKEELRYDVGILNPDSRPTRELQAASSFMHPIREGPLGASQFPNPVDGPDGPIHKPPSW